MNKKKIFLSMTALGAIAAPIAAVISCNGSNGPKNEFASSKDIVIAVDGAQKEMWDAVKKNFDATTSHTKNGFNIRFIQKDVWGAMDLIKTTGFTDENAPDIVYMPQDRLTDMIQQKALRKITDAEFNSIMTAAGATKKESEAALEYGTLKDTKTDKKDIFALSHNDEGKAIAYKTNIVSDEKAIETAKKQGMIGMMKNAEALWRLQDLWYGAALFGGKAEKEGKFIEHANSEFQLFGNKSNWNSGFIKTDSYHNGFKKITDAMAEMWYYPLLKAYKPTQLESEAANGENSPAAKWSKSGLTGDDLKNFFQSDMGAVHNMIVKAVNENKIKYMYAGTWDFQAITKVGIDGAMNAPTDLDGEENVYGENSFLQPKGTWSFAINARNNGVPQARIDAIFEILKNIYSNEAITAYFEKDTKIPFSTAKRDIIKSENTKSETNKTKPAIEIFDAIKSNSEIAALISESGKDESALTPFEKVYIVFKAIANKEAGVERDYSKLHIGDWDKEYNDLSTATYETSVFEDNKNQFLPAHGIQEMYKAILNLKEHKSYKKNDDGKFIDTGGNELTDEDSETNRVIESSSYFNAWKFYVDSLKTNEASQKNSGAWDGDGIHIRKIGQGDDFLGFNTDDADGTKSAIASWADKFDNPTNNATTSQTIESAKTAFDTWADEIVGKTSAFVSKYLKEEIGTPEDKKAAVRKYLNVIFNQKLADYLKPQALAPVQEYNFITNDNKTKLNTIKPIISKAISSLSVNKVFDVINEKDANKIPFKTQLGRYDDFNPQFGTVWGLWNDQAFGNKVWLQTAIADANNLTKFKSIVENKFNTIFTDKTRQLISGNSTGIIELY